MSIIKIVRLGGRVWGQNEVCDFDIFIETRYALFHMILKTFCS